MGCGGSKSAVAPQQSKEAWLPESSKVRSSLTPSGGTPPSNTHIIEHGVIVKPDTDAMCAATDSTFNSQLSSRNISARSDKSQSSSATADSGLGDEYTNASTAISSKGEFTRKVAGLPEETDAPDHSIQVKASNPVQSQKEGITFASSNTAKHVKFDVGPQIRPISRAGIAFKVDLGSHSSTFENGKMPPTVLRKLKQHRKDLATREELEEKQKAADKRRKELEQQLLERIRAKQEKEREMFEAMQAFITQQAEKTENKMKTASENREAYLKNLRNRLREKS